MPSSKPSSRSPFKCFCDLTPVLTSNRSGGGDACRLYSFPPLAVGAELADFYLWFALGNKRNCTVYRGSRKTTNTDTGGSSTCTVSTAAVSSPSAEEMQQRSRHVSTGTGSHMDRTRPGELHILSSKGCAVVENFVRLEGERALQHPSGPCEKLLLKHENANGMHACCRLIFSVEAHMFSL
jgi:hypothetical protein